MDIPVISIFQDPATYFDILLNNRTGVQLAGYPYDSKKMPPLVLPQFNDLKHKSMKICK